MSWCVDLYSGHERMTIYMQSHPISACISVHLSRWWFLNRTCCDWCRMKRPRALSAPKIWSDSQMIHCKFIANSSPTSPNPPCHGCTAAQPFSSYSSSTSWLPFSAVDDRHLSICHLSVISLLPSRMSQNSTVSPTLIRIYLLLHSARRWLWIQFTHGRTVLRLGEYPNTSLVHTASCIQNLR